MTVLWRELNGLKEHLRTGTVDVEKAFTSSLDISQKPDKKNKKHFCIHLVHFYCSSKGTQH